MKRSRKNRATAFTLIEFFVVIAALAVMAAIILPALARTKCRSARIGCVNNLKQIGIGFRTFALDNNDKFPMQVPVTNGGTMELVGSGTVFTHFLVMSNELSTPKLLICAQEADRKHMSATTFAASVPARTANQIPFTNDCQVSYFVGVDADQTRPAMLLVGDMNLAFDGVPARHGLHSVWTNSAAAWVKPRHDKGGNICLADGSVQQVNNSGLAALRRQTGVATNLLAIP